MKTVKFFYAHTTQDLQVPDDTPVLTSKVDQLTSDRTGIEIVREAMENPIDSPRLCELAKGKDDCVIIISDHTRPVPSKDILPNMIEGLKMEYAPNLEAAYKRAREIKGEDASLTCIPNGISVVVRE